MEEFNRRWLAAWTAKDVEALLAFYTPDTLYFDQQTAAGIQGHAALGAYLTGLFGMTPPMRYEAEERPVARFFENGWVRFFLVVAFVLVGILTIAKVIDDHRPPGYEQDPVGR